MEIADLMLLINFSFKIDLFFMYVLGVKHTNICCDGCRQQGIMGLRWQCSQCPNYNLCQTCYMNDKHDLNHVFFRYVTSSSEQRLAVLIYFP